MQILIKPEKEVVMILLGGVMTIMSVIIGALLANFLNRQAVRSMERKRIEDEFAEIKNSIYYTENINYLSDELNKLSKFFIRYPKFLKVQENLEFFDNWAKNPLIERKNEVLLTWGEEKFNKFYSDLERTKLKW